MTVVAVEAEGLHIATGAVHVLRFATHGFATRPGDTPANVWFEPVIGETLPGLARTMHEGTGTYGASQVSIGTIELINIDGGLDRLVTDYAFDGRRVEVRAGELGQPYASWSPHLVGTLQTPETDGTTIRLVVRDRLADLETWERPVYAGTNVAGEGVEGTPDDLKGQTKPRVYGEALNVTPRPVNAQRWIYQASDQPATIMAVYDNGGALTRDTDYASLAELQSTAPVPGTYRRWQGLFRIGTRATGMITADVMSTPLDVTQILRRIALDAGIAPTDISDDSISLWSAMGVYAQADASPRELMDQIAASAGGWYGFDRLGRLRMGRLTAPTGPPSRTWRADSVLELTVRRVVPPAKRVIVRYGHNWTPQTQLVGQLEDSARAAWLREEYRTAEVDLAAVLVAWPNAADLSIDTQLRDQSVAASMANLLAGLHGVPRLEVAVKLPISELGAVDLGSVVSVDTQRYGLSTRLFVVIGMDSGQDGRAASVVLWG